MDFTRLVVPQEIEGPREPADISSAVNSLVILSKPVLALLIQLQKPFRQSSSTELRLRFTWILASR